MKGWDSNTLERLKQRGMVAVNNSCNNILKNIPDAKKSKYGNKITVVDDHRFDSAKEASRYQVLRHWRDMGAISNLQLQVRYELNTGGTFSRIYIADFVYMDNIINEIIVEDVKGCLTREYKKNRKLMKKLFGIVIKET